MIDSLSRRRALSFGASAALAAAAGLPARAFAQGAVAAWPGSRPLRIVVAYPAGGVSDVVARALADRLSTQLGSPVIVENKAGAGGAIAMDMVAKSPADGYTLYVFTIANTINASLYGRLGYDPQKDFEPIGLIAKIPN
ncbi:tripartite tricarboxylate transporter substrate binding protein, partial [Rhizobium phaseoli]|nr:tripartite tricarboxylate transporter substrate binding protein [Rhizobium phaseoli]